MIFSDAVYVILNHAQKLDAVPLLDREIQGLTYLASQKGIVDDKPFFVKQLGPYCTQVELIFEDMKKQEHVHEEVAEDLSGNDCWREFRLTEKGQDIVYATRFNLQVAGKGRDELERLENMIEVAIALGCFEKYGLDLALIASQLHWICKRIGRNTCRENLENISYNYWDPEEPICRQAIALLEKLSLIAA